MKAAIAKKETDIENNTNVVPTAFIVKPQKLFFLFPRNLIPKKLLAISFLTNRFFGFLILAFLSKEKPPGKKILFLFVGFILIVLLTRYFLRMAIMKEIENWINPFLAKE